MSGFHLNLIRDKSPCAGACLAADFLYSFIRLSYSSGWLGLRWDDLLQVWRLHLHILVYVCRFTAPLPTVAFAILALVELVEAGRPALCSRRKHLRKQLAAYDFRERE